jgi:cytochrome c peroxidase
VVAVIDVAALKRVGEVGFGPGRAPTAAERGEALFHDARLSFEAWFSCQSCHPGGHTSGRLNDNLTDGSLGTPKRVLSLLGTKDTGPWAWNGTMPALEAQLRTSVKSTMHAETAPTAGQVADLAAYLRTLAPPPSPSAARGALDAEAVRRGGRVFRREKCVACHTPPVYTSAKTYDVGLRDEAGGTHFNPPSLRGVSQAGPYFHDGRAATLRDVLTRFRHQLPDGLPEADVTDLLQFLQSL